MGAYDCDCINNLEYDRRERKAQLSKEGTTKGTTSDLISKTEAVEHLRRMLEATVPNTDYDEGFIDGVEFGISTVSTMPTIQPVATDTNVGDTISRQAAIDAFDKAPFGYLPDQWMSIKTLKELPSAQPEPHEGEWINTNPEYKNGFYNNSYYCSECHDYYTTSPYEMKFCPNCGAKMTITK